jgi:hypothetical protein
MEDRPFRHYDDESSPQEGGSLLASHGFLPSSPSPVSTVASDSPSERFPQSLPFEGGGGGDGSAGTTVGRCRKELRLMPTPMSRLMRGGGVAMGSLAAAGLHRRFVVVAPSLFAKRPYRDLKCGIGVIMQNNGYVVYKMIPSKLGGIL